MLNRRRFVQSLIVAAAGPTLSVSCRADDPRLAVLRPDPQRLLDLPEGFSYEIVSSAGDIMNDGCRCQLHMTGWLLFRAKTVA